MGDHRERQADGFAFQIVQEERTWVYAQPVGISSSSVKLLSEKT
jgi:hypothetical protein